MFKKKVKDTGIFDDLPVAPNQPSIKREELKKSGRRAMVIPETPATADVRSDQLLTNTGKQREQWLEIIFQSAHREEKQRLIASWLQDSHRVQKWWANSIALMYLDWREAPKTSSSNSVIRISRTIDAPSFRVFNILNSEKLYGSDFKRFLKQVDSERLVLSFEDDSRASITFQQQGASCEILIEHEFIGGQSPVKSRTVFWKKLIDQVSSQVSP
jgi:hypothetical protein